MIPVEAQIHLNKFKPRWYQERIMDAIENKGYKRVLAILPRRAGKDIVGFNIGINACIERPCIIYYIFPTYSQAKKVIWDSLTNEGNPILDYIPPQLIASKNSQEMKIRFTNGSLLQLVGSDNYDCFDDQTEILTENGWKLFKDLDRTERVATLDGRAGDGHYFEWEKPLKYVEYDYDGEMYAVQNSSMDFMVTPNHRFYVKSTRGAYKFKEINDPTIRHDAIPSTCRWTGDGYMNEEEEKQWDEMLLGYDSSDFAYFLGIYLSEGSTFSNHKCYRITIAQVKQHVRDNIRRTLTNMNISFTELPDRFNIENKKLYEYCVQFGTQPYRFIPTVIKNKFCTYDLEILLDALIDGDGTRNDTYTAYYSTSKRLIDDVQEIIIKLGLSGNVRIRKQTASRIKGRVIKSKRPLYEIRVRKSKYKRLQGTNGKQYIKQVPYKGKVYCVSVPSGVIKVRRNGKEMWSGNSLMGTNPYGCVFSEYALQDPRAYQYIRPILTANDGFALFLSTPRGKNHLWTLYQIAQQSKQWFCMKMTVEETRHIPLSLINKEKADGIMSDDLIQQEYYTSFDMGIEGAYYAKYLDQLRVKGQIGQVPWENGFKVNTAWDLGMRDSTCIIFYQVIGQTIRIINCYENSKEGLEHYVRVLESKPYSYGRHFFPHDIKVRELGTGITRLEKMRQLGVKGTIAPNAALPDGIEAVRTSLSKMWFDAIACAPLLKALENYRQEYDVKKKIYKQHPLHDWSSHYADAMRYLCVCLPRTQDGLTGDQIERNYREAMYGDRDNIPDVFKQPGRY